MATSSCDQEEEGEEEEPEKEEKEEEVQEVLSSRVKGFHSRLRAELRTGKKDVDTQWRDLLRDRDSLREYSTAMFSLATGPWTKHGDGDRIGWCVDTCREYFCGGQLKKLLLKDLRRIGHGMPTLVSRELLPPLPEAVESLVTELSSKPWDLLDVGSCYNPFARHPEFQVTAIDIAPAVESVQKCDFINVEILRSTPSLVGTSRGHDSDDNWLRRLSAESFDVVVFCLLLSYFPTTRQRLQCCVNAHKLLHLHGILVVITPDSSHQNRHAAMMKSWKACIEGIGFHRWKYTKDTHLHCMAFRKTTTKSSAEFYSGLFESHSMLYIPQDRQEGSESETGRSSSPASVQTQQSEQTGASFQELPFGVS